MCSNGDYYTGDWRDDKPNGRGRAVYNDRSIYEGKFKDGKPHGFGTMVVPNRRPYSQIEHKYQGNWANGLLKDGTETNDHGDRYDGSWKKGLKQGDGTLTLATGDVFTGSWHNDRIEGYKKGIILFKDGSSYEGTGNFKKRKYYMSGQGTFKYPNGLKIEGYRYENDLEIGQEGKDNFVTITSKHGLQIKKAELLNLDMIDRRNNPRPDEEESE